MAADFEGRGMNGSLVRRYSVIGVPRLVVVDADQRPVWSGTRVEALDTVVSRLCARPDEGPPAGR